MSTIVLVGGSFLGAWAWERVTPALVEAGHDVVPLTLTGFGDRAHLATPETALSTHVTDITAAIETADLRDVVLVLHSYAGVPGTVAATRVDARIARIVYVAAALPTPGKSVFDTSPPQMEQMMRQLADAQGDGWRVPVMSDEILDTFYGEHGLGAEDRAWLRARAVGHPIATLREPVPSDLSLLERIDRTYVVCTGDPGEPPVADDTPGFDVVALESGHWPMITAPVSLAGLIDRMASRR
ncbi:pimeloyl-ACP methyl ester carboxylesterase [Haloactinopolyspora alba]|uniref:Pimeloyl-ACP methyl ester carboxylesterase n=1 Tax=Haloactinopolyspora alba TaxID=648780 RepID=A0A2P8DY04_9ACTN|nr:alpha/beta hydrolase [Haloactinopolyspora alba]PSL02082.1 pimeloyl-ACP methyl ester carboxylesterase [Haloactinopolyspora alba]